MHPGRPDLRGLVLGIDRRRRWLTLGLAALYLVAGVGLEYLLLLTEYENEWLVAIQKAFVIDGVGLYAGGMTVVGLAAIPAYFYAGYLPSVALGWAPGFGATSWQIDSTVGVENYYLDPVPTIENQLLGAIVFGTVGFSIGLALRTSRESDPESASRTSARDDAPRDRH